MGWNGSSNVNEKPASIKQTTARGVSSKKGLTAGLIVVLCAGAVIWWKMGADSRTEKVVDKNATTNRIGEVQHAVSQTSEEESAIKPLDPNARPTKVGEVVNGYVLLPSGRMHKRVGVITNSVAMRPKGKYHIFKRSCDNEIAAYLSMKPGDTLVGSMRYNGRFVKDFLEALKEPIEITDEDTPEQVELKNAVIAARKDLKEAYDNGEDIEKIMADTREELQKMYLYKQQLTHEFNTLRKEEGMTAQDVEDLFDACNKMLEEKGISPMKFGPITRRRMMSILNQE